MSKHKKHNIQFVSAEVVGDDTIIDYYCHDCKEFIGDPNEEDEEKDEVYFCK